jgi:FMN phosphatase YigB (HAD superfamily)
MQRFPNLGAPETDKIRAIWRAQVEEGFAIEGASLLLEKLAESGCHFGIISDIWKPYFSCFERIFAPFMHLFQFRVLSFETGAAKPSPLLYQKAMKHYSNIYQNGHPSRVLMIGDSYRLDMAPAMQMGMSAAWILSKPERELTFMADVLSGKAPSPQIIARSTLELAEEKIDAIKSALKGPVG